MPNSPVGRVALRTRRGRSTGASESIPTMSTGSLPRASPAKLAAGAFTLEGRYRRYDGEYRWLRTVSQPRFGPDGELVGFIGVGTDITLAKEAELELRRQVDEQTAQLAASEAQFRAVFEAALEVMVLLQPDGTVIAVNNRREAWRHDDPVGSNRAQDLGCADDEILSAARRANEGSGGHGRERARYSPPRPSSRVKVFRPPISTSRSSQCARPTARSSICCSKRATSPSSKPRRSSSAKARRWRRSGN